MYKNKVEWRNSFAVTVVLRCSVIAGKRYAIETAYQTIPILKMIFHSKLLTTERYSKM